MEIDSYDMDYFSKLALAVMAVIHALPGTAGALFCA